MKIFTLFFCLLASFPAFAEEETPLQLQQPAEPENLIIYNRILAKVNGKAVSVIDVMKRMELFLQKHYAHLSNSNVARYQFFSSQWRDFLAQIIDQELMIADAAKLEVKVSDAEVREEILNRFGPNIMPTLDKMGFTYDEARQAIHDDILVNKMMWFRVNSKAMTKVNSQDVKEAYKVYCEKNPAMEEWEYQVLSVRSAQKDASELLAKRAFDLLGTKLELAKVSEELKDENVTVTLSAELKADEKTVSESHKEVLKTLSDDTFSEPIAQVSRADNSVVYRIFYLKKHSKRELPIFEKIADDIKEHLLQQAAGKENQLYITKLRERLGYDEKYMKETLPENFQPFALK